MSDLGSLSFDRAESSKGGNWGLGVAGAFGYHNVADGDVNENWSGTSFVLRFTATMT